MQHMEVNWAEPRRPCHAPSINDVVLHTSASFLSEQLCESCGCDDQGWRYSELSCDILQLHSLHRSVLLVSESDV
jgi:hypothetical protein